MNIDRYELQAKLGQSTTASAYRAYDPKLQRDVVLKLFAKVGDDDARLRRFQREARALASLRHPNIIQVYDFGAAEDGRLYIVTEFVRGQSLATLLQQHGAFAEPMLLAVSIELAAALTHAHVQGVIHRAISPENVLIDRGRLVLCDFGMVKAFHRDSPLGPDAAEASTAVVGVPGFIAPEQLEQMKLDERTDIFGLGVLAYYLASKKLPYEAESIVALREQFRFGKPNALQGLRRDLSRHFCGLVHRCLAPEASQRPESALIVRLMLQQSLEQGGQRDAREILSHYEREPELTSLAWSTSGNRDSGEQPALPRPVKPHRHRWLWLATATVTVALLAAALAKLLL